MHLSLFTIVFGFCCCMQPYTDYRGASGVGAVSSKTSRDLTNTVQTVCHHRYYMRAIAFV